MAITLEQLENIDIDALKTSLIQYADALDHANLAISNLNASKVELEAREIPDTTSLNEEIDKLNKSLTTQKNKNKKLNDENKELVLQIESLNLKISDLEAGLPESETSETVLDISEYTNEIEKLKEELQKIIEANSLLKNDLISKDKAISKLEKNIEQLNTKFDGKPIVTNESKTRYHTYSVNGYDNRSGLAVHAGPLYVKAVIIVKYNDGMLSWQIKSPDLNMDLVKTKELNDSEKESIENRATESTYYQAFKEFLEIPETVETEFSKELVLIKG